MRESRIHLNNLIDMNLSNAIYKPETGKIYVCLQ